MVGYFGYAANAQQEENFKIYRMISESENQLQQDFFATYPEIKEEYCQWLEDKK
ncbi:hypothetical protein RM553_15365 [Zunongwangia sp. F363]|uniref:Uncharacterized protein n=1 Tax=Autumnicola tepida TaxID=3075595 RepID=A0ABU3CDV9_9FLAO|nr:hypothetical protein [Zunongwangia sp. F363]MDT0644215.1 hypothetical protein [Zunongwangia sp. F363]